MQRALLRAWAKAKIKGLENFNAFLSLAWKRKMAFAGILAAVLLLFFYWNLAKALLLMAVFTGVGILSLYYMKYVRISVGIELVMLGTVIMGLLYGAVPAIITGLAALFIAELITERMTHSTAVSFLGIGIVGLAVPLFPKEWGITAAGIAATLLYDAIIIPLYILLGSSPGRSAVFVITHLAFNVWVFSFIAPPLFRFLS